MSIINSHSDVPAEVLAAFNAWTEAHPWSPGCSRAQAGRIGAARRKLNRVLAKHGLTFLECAPHIAPEEPTVINFDAILR